MNGSDSDEDNFICYGTPLDPIEEDDVPTKRKFQQAPDQYAVDDHGRRRFHGAFTGGFSAGFGNTVGSAEGWTPATFKSSRAEKAQISVQQPVDFMDEEDRGEFGIAPRYMQTHSEFSSQKRKLQRYHDGPIPGEPVLEQLLKAVHETAAVKMLRVMGWKPGQGTGDRLTKDEKKKAKEQHKVFGCYIPPEMRQNVENEEVSGNESSDSEFDYETLFAPDDYEPYLLQRKSDRFGLGYSGLSRHSVLGNLTGQYGESSSKSHLVLKEKGKRVSIRGQAFGVGAFEADDEDIYATEDMSHYDFQLGELNDSKKKNEPSKLKGVNVLEGFVKASKPQPSIPSYPPPALQRDYVPIPAGARRTRFEPTTEPQRDQGLGRHELSAEARGALLGEEPPPKISDPITTSKEDQIAKALGRNVNFITTNDNKTPESSTNQIITLDMTTANENRELDFISIKDTGNEIPKTFKPFKSVPEKQTRYENYLKDKESFIKEGNKDTDALSEWERNRELAEFEQAAKLYKPLTGIMGDRFTHASEPDDALNPLTTVARSSTNYGLATPEQIEAAKKGVYGVMTRKEVPWRPESLVCKRFNIPDPGGVRTESKSEAKPKISYSVFSYLESSVHDKDSFAKEQSKFSGSKSMTLPKPIQAPQTIVKPNNNEMNKVNVAPPSTSTENTGFNKRMTVAELFLKESEKDIKNNEGVDETIEKFDKMDLYKAIFLSDSENEDDNRTNVGGSEKDDDFIDKPKNVVRNLSPPRGIFANIDFDELNSWRRNTDTDKTDKNKDNKKVEDKSKEEQTEAAVYGPKIPENLKIRLEGESNTESDLKPVYRRKTERDEVHEINSSSSSDSWVDVKEVKSKKNKKKKKKHKSKHKKIKHKKKDK